MTTDVDHDSLYALLKEVQLEHFYHPITSIDVTKVEHFENVVFEDLTSQKVGMGAPAARRLLEAAKKRNNKWKKNLLNIILPTKSTKEKDDKFSSVKFYNETESNNENIGLTCLIANNDIKLLDKIGDGSFGVVMRAQWTQPNKSVRFVAVKVLKQEVLLRALEDFAKEVNAMHQLKHANLIKLYGIVLSSPMMMVTELAEQGSLRSKLLKTLGRISISTLVDYSTQIANGMDYLESKRLIHRDLATRNIFLTETNTIKIGDFGLMRSVPFDEDYYTMSDNVKVPFPWCAIESLKYRQFSHASDTWMYGVTLWEIFSFGQEPWAGLNGSQLLQKLEQNERLKMPDTCPQRIYQVIDLCWKREPKERPTFGALIKFFIDTKPIRLKAIDSFDNASTKFVNFQNQSDKAYLKICNGDEIEVIEGRPENYWWKGQSQRSFDVGFFPRSIAKDLRSLDHSVISKPLKNSFIHTGHMDPMGKKSWGNPEFIEKMYLEHPTEPPDVLGFQVESLPPPELETRDGVNVRLDNGKNTTKIDKILSINDLNKMDKPDDLIDDYKEDILIDFNDEISVNSVKAQEIMVSLQNDLAGINFTSSSNNDLFDLNESNQHNNEPKTIELDISPMKKLNDSSKFDVFNQMSSHQEILSKYYSPPIDAQPDPLPTTRPPPTPPPPPPPPLPESHQSTISAQSTKNRYYSAVCSNCDFSNDIDHNSCILGDNICQCCGEFSNDNPITNQFLPNSHCINSCTDAFYSANFKSLPVNETSLHNVTLSDCESRPVYKTQICKEFIQELEANFSNVTPVKLTETTDQMKQSSSTVSFPIINPPPRPFKTRRPAPPPPVQKKVN